MKPKITILALFLIFISVASFAQIPLVYDSENTGAGYATPPLPPIGELPFVEPLTDPFIWSDNSGRSTTFSDWARRRSEIKHEIEHYEIGTKPNRPDTITATYETDGTYPAGVTGRLIVSVTVNGETLTLTSNVSLPAGTGPFPAVIGMNSLNGSIPADIFTSRNIARITYSHNNVTTYGNPQPTDPFFRLYPEQNPENTGQYAAWAWGVSRLIDGLELVQASLPIDLTHVGVTGCSYAGKMALFAGALDERVALTIAQESGGGGAPAWRVSETLGDVEKLGATDYRWFKDDMRQFSGSNVSYLPHDHHELMAMVAPRALLVTGNTDFTWLANPALYVSARAAHEVYKTFGIGDRFGFYVDGGHNHCAIPVSQRPAIEAFVQKFLAGDTTVNTDVTVHPYPDMDYERWYKWWGTGDPVLPAEPIGIRIWMEAECGTVGSDWQTLPDSAASNGAYVVVNGLNSTGGAPAGAEAAIVLPFAIDSAANYNLMARLNCPSANDDSYWIKFDDGPFIMVNGLATSGWQWLRLRTGENLSVGPHTLTIAYREDGAKLDKVLLTTSGATIREIGTQGSNCGAAPTIVPDQVFSISENAFNNAPVGNVVATDPDDSTEFQNWKINGGTGAAVFSIDASTGQLMVKDSASLDFESSSGSYNLILTVTDGYFKSAPDTVIINLVNLNDNPPGIAEGQVFSLSENAANGTSLGMVAATDADDTNQPGFTDFQDWKITGGTGAWFFNINENTGELTARAIPWFNWFDFEKITSYSLMVSVSDGTSQSEAKVINVNIVNENDNRPDVKRFQHFYIDTWVADGDVAGTVAATDKDDRNEPGFTTFQNWQITGGSGERYFDIDPVTGALIIERSNSLNRDGGETYSLRVKVSDGKYRSESEYVTLYVSRKVEVCHRGRTKEVNRNAVQSHLRHGDSPNACDGESMQSEPLAGADEDQHHGQYDIYPNPVTTSTREIIISLGSNDERVKKVELVEFNTSRLVKVLHVRNESRVTIPSDDLSRGMYILRLLGDKPITKVIVVK